MSDITHMQTSLETVLTDSKLALLFKPGRVKIKNEKLPHSVNIRTKLHNPYTVTAFEIIEQKYGLKFVICHQKTMPKKLRLALLELGGSPDNGNTRFEFPFEHALQVAESFFKFCMTPEIVELCQAQDYKPYKLLTADAKEPEEA